MDEQHNEDEEKHLQNWVCDLATKDNRKSQFYMTSLYLLVSSSPKPSWLHMSNQVWEERYYYTRSLYQAEDIQVHGTEGKELTNDANKLLSPLKCHGEQEKSSVNEKGKFLASLPEREAGRSWKLQAGLPHLSSWESHRRGRKKNKKK